MATAKKYLTKEQILGAVDSEVEDVKVPEWGGVVRVRGLTGVERDQYESSMWEGKGTKRTLNTLNTRARLASLTCVDGDGARLFTDSDVKALGNKSAAALERVVTVAMRLSGLTEQDLDEIAGNLDETDGEGSS